MARGSERNGRGTGTYAGPLAGVRVLDLTRVLAGPYATQILGDLGAEVIKVEEPGTGDSARHSGPKVGGESTHFMTANRNKKSIVLDLKSPQGKAVALDLVRACDVLVENYRPGVLERLGLDYEHLEPINPRIVVCSISGFGQTGPLRDRTSFDAIAQAATGAMAVTGEEGGGPVRMGIPMGDLSGGVFGAIAVLAALHERDRTGRGGAIDIAMYDAMISLTHYFLTDYLVTGEEPGKMGSGNPSIYPYGAFPTSDGHIILSAYQPRFWNNLCQLPGFEGLANDPRFSTNDLRCAHRQELYEIMAPVMRQKTREEWGRLLDLADIPNGAIQSVADVANHPHTLARRMVSEVEHPSAGRIKIPGRPIKFPPRDQVELQPAPRLGEHTAEILQGLLGYPPDHVRALAESGAIGLLTHGPEI